MSYTSAQYVSRRSLVGDQHGFTLLEMLLVVFILAAIALSTVSFTNNADDQFRYEDTQRRLLAIRRAIVGDHEATYQGQRLLSGYVVDNGLLPTTLTSLLSVSGLQTTYGAKTPEFDPQPDQDGYNNDSGIPISGSQSNLFKGHRGSYLLLTPSATTVHAYRDGWGNTNSGLPNDPNFGWLATATTTPTATFITTSTGANGQIGGSDYDADLADTITENDWRQNVNGWFVRLTTPIATTLTTNLRVSLLVHENSPATLGGSRWKRLTSTVIPKDTVMTPLTPLTVTFPDPALSSIPTQVPIGQHLLVAVQDPDGTPHTPDDAPLTVNGKVITRRVSFFPHTVLPEVELVIP